MNDTVESTNGHVRERDLAEMLRCNRESYKNLEIKTRQLQEGLNRIEQLLWTRRSAKGQNACQN